MFLMDWPLWIDFFDELQNVRGRSQNTVLAYKRDLELWFTYRSKTPTDVQGFYEFLKQHQLSTRSQARVISSVRTYLRFCETRGGKSPELRELRPPKVKVGLPKALTIEEFEKLLISSRVEDEAKTNRNRLTLLFLFGTGVRVTELIGLNLRDYQATEKWIKVVGKGGKERLVPLTDLLVEALDKYLSEFRPQLVGSDDPESIFVNDRGHRPSRIDIWRWLAAWSHKAGFAEPIHPHRFRHGCATALLEGGADLRSIQMILGHSSIQTTQIYTNVSQKHLRDEVLAKHPLAEAIPDHHQSPKDDEILT